MNYSNILLMDPPLSFISTYRSSTSSSLKVHRLCVQSPVSSRPFKRVPNAQQKAFPNHFLQQISDFKPAVVGRRPKSLFICTNTVTAKLPENKAFCNPGTISECVSVVKIIKLYSTEHKQNNLLTVP